MCNDDVRKYFISIEKMMKCILYDVIIAPYF